MKLSTFIFNIQNKRILFLKDKYLSRLIKEYKGCTVNNNDDYFKSNFENDFSYTYGSVITLHSL